MLDIIPKEIKKYFLILFFIGIIAFFFGLSLKNKYIYIAYSMGILFSMISNLLLLYSSYKIVYEYAGKVQIGARFIFSMILYAISMYLSNYIINDKLSILFNALGLLTFRFIIYFYHFIENKKRK